MTFWIGWVHRRKTSGVSGTVSPTRVLLDDFTYPLIPLLLFIDRITFSFLYKKLLTLDNPFPVRENLENFFLCSKLSVILFYTLVSLTSQVSKVMYKVLFGVFIVRLHSNDMLRNFLFRCCFPFFILIKRQVYRFIISWISSETFRSSVQIQKYY